MLSKIGSSMRNLTGQNSKGKLDSQASMKKLVSQGTQQKLDTATIISGSAVMAGSAAGNAKAGGESIRSAVSTSGQSFRGQPKMDTIAEDRGGGREGTNVLNIGQDEVPAPPQPAIFVSMGSPSLLIETSEGHAFFRELGMKYNYPERKPSCIICISARWVSDGGNDVKIMSAELPKTCHDFYGFAECLYEVQYLAKGSSEAAAKIAEALTAGGIEWEFDGLRSFDFGCWSPLALIFPDASIPVVQVSLHSSLNNETHIAIGEALAPLRDDGFLILCAGNVTHNLLELSFGQSHPPSWAVAFDTWVEEVLLYEERQPRHATLEDAWRARNSRLVEWNDQYSAENIYSSAMESHHTPHYFLPLLVAAGSGGTCTQLHQSWAYGSISMASYMFGELPPRKGVEQNMPDEDVTRPTTTFTTLESARASMMTASEISKKKEEEAHQTAAATAQQGTEHESHPEEEPITPSAQVKPPSRLGTPASGSRSRPPSRDLVNRAARAGSLSGDAEAYKFAQQLSQLTAAEGLSRHAPQGE